MTNTNSSRITDEGFCLFVIRSHYICSENDTAERRLFDYTGNIFQYYWPVRPLTPMESIFFQQIKLNLFNQLSTNLNFNKSKSYSENNNIINKVNIDNKVDISNKIDDKILWVDGLPPTDLNKTKIESCSNYCNMCNLVDKKISFIEEIQPNPSNPYCFRSECHSNNTIDSNRNIMNMLGI